jgi:hypothetical protein
MFNKVFFPQNSAVYDGKILYIRTDHRWQYNKEHALSVLET